MPSCKKPTKSAAGLWSRRRLLGAGLESAKLIGAAQLAGAASMTASLMPSLAAGQKPTPDITTTDIRGLILLQAPEWNVIAVPGDDGALMVDGGLAADAEALLSTVLDITGNDRVQTLINTHWHAEQTGANELVGSSGGLIFAHENTAMYLSNRVYLTAEDRWQDPLPESARPQQTTRGEGSLDFAGMRIDYGHLPQAHTDGDLYLHFPDNNVLVAGGVVSGERWPLLDYRNGAWYGGRVRALQWLAELIDADTSVVPADGRIITSSDIVRQRDIYLELFETMIGYMNMGLGAEDVVERNPLEQYEPEFGDASAFLDGAYRSMQIAYVPD